MFTNQSTVVNRSIDDDNLLWASITALVPKSVLQSSGLVARGDRKERNSFQNAAPKLVSKASSDQETYVPR